MMFDAPRAEKRCRLCQSSLPFDMFHRDRKAKDGRMGVCVPCNKRRVQEWREKQREARERNRKAVAKYREAHRDEINARNRERYREDLDASREKERQRWHRRVAAGKTPKKDPKKVRARKALEAAIRSGLVVKPDRCEGAECEGLSTQLEAHHTDYDKPLDVTWLCTMCHRKHHHS